MFLTKKPAALLFALGGVILMACIGVSLSYQSLGSALLFTILTVLFIGCGFIVKARITRK
ncbi:MAG TPA: DUF5325 family protein [Bacilli bacterium]